MRQTAEKSNAINGLFPKEHNTAPDMIDHADIEPVIKCEQGESCGRTAQYSTFT